MSWSLLYLISQWIIRIAMIPIVMRRRRPSAALAWLSVIFVLPWVGFLAYLLIGEVPLARRRIRRRQRLAATRAVVDRIAHQHPHAIRPAIDPDQMRLVTLGEDLGDMPILGGNHAALLAATDDVIDRLVADIDRATSHVHLLFYIFLDDGVGMRVADALVRAARRGVRCRVLADGVGSRRLFKRLAPRLVAEGVEVREALPVRPLRRGASRVDLRNHRKLAVIDGRVGYTGSQNIVEATYGHRDLAWYDLMVRLTGPIVLQIQMIFVEDWAFETEVVLDDASVFPSPDVSGDLALQTVPSGPTHPTEGVENLLMAAIYRAKEQILITSPYFVPDEPLLMALRVAAIQGVRVEVVVPARTDHPLVNAAGRAYFESLLEAGVEIYRFRPGLLHAKTMTVDDSFSLIGSSNFDVRSFFLNFEVNLICYGASITAELRFLQRSYIQAAERLTWETWTRRPAYQRLGEDAAKLLSPLL